MLLRSLSWQSSVVLSNGREVSLLGFVRPAVASLGQLPLKPRCDPHSRPFPPRFREIDVTHLGPFTACM
jgi:hypothetical protein